MGKQPTGCKVMRQVSWISMATHLSLAKGVTRHAKFILKTKNIFSKYSGVLQTIGRVLSGWHPYTICKQGVFTTN